MLFNYFLDSNEGIADREAEITGSIVKCGERPLEKGGMWNSHEAPHERWCYGNCPPHSTYTLFPLFPVHLPPKDK